MSPLPQRFTVVEPVFADYRTVSQLAGVAAYATTMLEGLMQAQGGGIVVRLGDSRKPPDGAGGVDYPNGGGSGWGPVQDVAAGLPFREVWVRRADPDVAASVVIQGVME